MDKIFNVVKFKKAVNPANLTSTGSGNALTCNGYDRACYEIVHAGVSGSGTFSVYESADNSTYTAVSSGSLVTTGSAAELKVIDVPVTSGKPYQKVVYTISSGSSIGAVNAILYNGSHVNPPTQDNTVTAV